jgi:uncharacterized protein
MPDQDALRLLQRIAAGIERMGAEAPVENEIKSADAYVWNAAKKTLVPITNPQRVDLQLLLGIDEEKNRLLDNTLQFARGYSANNVLLWGARGMGKSSLVKAVHQQANRQMPHSLVLVEIRCEDIKALADLIDTLRGWVIRRFIIFCDDLSFDKNSDGYSSLKGALEGGIQHTPDHILFYATSNRHHEIPQMMISKQHASEIEEEENALLDRFGICLGFQPCLLDRYLSIASTLAAHYGLTIAQEDLHQQAFLWMQNRGACSGRVARQFIQDLAGKMGKRLI